MNKVFIESYFSFKYFFCLYFRAQIVKENAPQPIVLDLFDNGSGSDLVANDGIYR